MEPFFNERPRYHIEKAAVTGLLSSTRWPPTVAVFGYARLLRVWGSIDEDKPVFSPVESTKHADGDRCIAAAFLGAQSDGLATLDASSDASLNLD